MVKAEQQYRPRQNTGTFQLFSRASLAVLAPVHCLACSELAMPDIALQE